MRSLTAILFILLAVSGVSAAHASGDGGSPPGKGVDITGVEVTSDGDHAVVSFGVSIGKKAARGNRMITVTPVLVSSVVRRELTPIRVRGRGAYISQVRRARAAGTVVTNEGMILLENGETYSYSESLPSSQLAMDSRLVFESDVMIGARRGESSCEAAANFVGERLDVVMPSAVPNRTTGDKISANYAFVEALPDSPVRFTDEIRDNALVVYFELGSYALNREYRDNEDILGQIVAAINIIARAGDSEIATVMLAGFASPEGSMQRNALLSERRGLALRDYITTYTRLRADEFVMHSGGADWNGLRMMVQDSDMPYRAEVLDIIDNTPEWDAAAKTGRMDAIRKLDGGRVFERLRSDFFPELRNTAYIKVYYKNKQTGK